VDLVVITRFLNGFLMIAMPIALGIYLVNRLHSGGKIWMIGAATFIISQVGHLPFNSYMLNPILGTIQQGLHGVVGNLAVALLLGLSAGIFEECARYGMFRWWLKDKRTWKTGVIAGAGHGGIEAIILGIIVMMVYLNMVALRNSDLSNLNLTPDQIEITRQQIQAYWNVSWYDTLFGAIERAFTIPFHIMASVLVVQVFSRRPGQQLFGWLGLAIVSHTLMDASVVFIAGQWGGYAAEAVLGIMAVFEILIIFALRQPEPTPPVIPADESIIPSSKYIPEPIEESAENLEKTRYQ
jgi:uncharacterized membrane protein YhfC